MDSWNEPQCGFHYLCDSHCRPRIGAASTVFSVVNALLCRHFLSAIRTVVWIANGDCCSTQVEHFADLREQNQSFSDLAGWSGGYSSGTRN